MKGLLLSVVLFAASTHAGDDEDLSDGDLKSRSHQLYGNSTFRLVGFGAYQTGFNPSHAAVGRYSRAVFGAAFEGGYLGLFTSLGTLQGIEFRATAGYGLAEQYEEEPKAPRSGGLIVRAEARWLFCPRFLRFNTWRVLAMTGIGLEADGGRWSDTWRAFALLGIRGQLFLSKESSVMFDWGWMPGTLNKDFTLRLHQAELLLALGSFHLGARVQLDFVGSVEGPGVGWQGGGVVGYAF